MKKIALTAAILSTIAFGHDAWMQKSTNNEAIVYWGHLGKELKTVDATKIENIYGFDKNLKKAELKTQTKDQNTTLDLDKSIAMAYMQLKPSYKVVTPDGTKYGIGKREVKGQIVSSAKGVKYSKAIFEWSDKLAKPIGLPLEIVVLKNPFKAKVGEKLEIQTFQNSKPIGNLKLVVDGVHDENKTISTDANGKALILLDKKGLKLIATKKDSPLSGDLDADTLSESANMAFVVK